ncbi:MAG: 3-hydroxyacyl-[acyl-carrier-protein] dehydratase FabZ [Candidatus Coatesbacteria bacterium]|nr:MAG: 3-hydroxyacyl-[acyl-carrier-protein] dehydratase FabZ [Candidatus Coatesbacteria bacterium]
MDVQGIMRFLPHRFPFLLVDRILEMDVEQGTITGLKNVSVNEWFFQGHFPEQKVMPGVLLVESLAQTGAVLLMNMLDDIDNKLLVFMTIDSAKFRRPVVPGDQLKLDVTKTAQVGIYVRMKGKATVEGKVAAELVMSTAVVEKGK